MDWIEQVLQQARKTNTRPIQSVVLRALAFYGLGMADAAQGAIDPDELEDLRQELADVNRAMAQITEGD